MVSVVSAVSAAQTHVGFQPKSSLLSIISLILCSRWDGNDTIDTPATKQQREEAVPADVLHLFSVRPSMTAICSGYTIQVEDERQNCNGQSTFACLCHCSHWPWVLVSFNSLRPPCSHKVGGTQGITLPTPPSFVSLCLHNDNGGRSRESLSCHTPDEPLLRHFHCLVPRLRLLLRDGH